MAQVYRVFVEKKPGFNVEAGHMLGDLRDNLGIGGLKSVRLLNRYDVSGVDREQFERALTTVFAEPNADDVYLESFDAPKGARVFAMEYLPGQYDQRADSAVQCIQLLAHGARPSVRTARVVALEGDIDQRQFERIRDYCINPVESRLASPDKPDTLALAWEEPSDIPCIEGFCAMGAAALAGLHREMGLAMSLEDIAFVQRYYIDRQRREPTVTEIRVIDTYWSDHCRHTTFLTRLEKIEIEPGKPVSSAIELALAHYLGARAELYGEKADKRPVTLMDIATCGVKLIKKRGLLQDLDESGEINACSIEVPVVIDGKTETYLVQFKNETHNHPTEIEPFGGAATCLGGAIRDPLSGRAYVYQAMRVTGGADPRTPVEQTLPGKLPQRKITTGAAQGYSSYGNQIGLATGQVVELYHPGYVAKRMEIGAVIGASPKAQVRREEPVPGDVVVLLGGRTGRDGCGGATGSSKAHTDESIATCGAEVQKGNPPTERKIQRLFRDAFVSRMIKKCNDFGAGGVCVAIGELADGLLIHLDRVPLKYEGLDGTELAISESQERMAVVLDASDAQRFIEAAARENLEAVVVADVTDSGRLQMRWRSQLIVDIGRDFLNTNGVAQTARAYIPAPDLEQDYRDALPASLAGLPFAQSWLKNAGRLNVCAQKGLVERFDASIGAGTVLMPFGGKTQLTPEEAMLSKIPVSEGETDTATAMSYGFMPALSCWSPFHGALWSVIESLSKLAAIGADPLRARLSMQEYFERMGEDPERWGKPAAALLGAFLAQRELNVPSIGGKDSMSGSFNDLDVPPTLVTFAVAATSAAKTVSAAFKRADSDIALLPIPTDAQGLPDFPAVRALYRRVHQLCRGGRVRAAAVVREGGLSAALLRMCVGNRIGVDLSNEIDAQMLYAPRCGDIVLELESGSGNLLWGLEWSLIGRTMGFAAIRQDLGVVTLDALERAWLAPLESVFPTDTPQKPDMRPVPLYDRRSAAKPKARAARPRVFLPVFPGTNCETDSAGAFERAGADVELFVFRNMNDADIDQSTRAIAACVDRAQIVMLPGGFSAGDEPDGSGKFIATTLRNPRVADAIARLLEVRDGLMLGICNGFQALIKLGLVPYGRIRDIEPDDPTLTFNSLGRHVSRMVDTRVTSVKSPWLRYTEPGDVYSIALSHGEGRFVASDRTLQELIANGQIATQYVDPMGIPSADIAFNPNGSLCAIEGITSPDGRVLGKMAHNERVIGRNIALNVPGVKDQRLFEAGVDYFR